jgi:hypothetical protein
MADSSDELERMNREQLVLKARVLGVERAELMTRVELRDEIVRRSEPDLAQQKRARGFLGVARDLVASVVEAGLNLPDAAAIIRGDGSRENDWRGPPPVATVTLAEIYATQGHLERALRMLDEVLAKEPDHDPARALRDRLAAGADQPSPAPRRRQRVSFADPPSEPAVVTEPAVVAEPAVVPAPSPPLSLITLSLSGQRQVYWEVPEATWAALRARSPSGRALLRVVSFRTRAGKVERQAQDLTPRSEVGSVVLAGLRADAVVRAVLGWETDGHFQPFLIASDLASTSPSSNRGGPFHAHPLVGSVAPGVEERALLHLARR